MKRNMGVADRLLRLIVVVVIAILIYLGEINGTTAIVLGIVAGIFLLTSLISFCPLYVPLKINTRSGKKK